MNEIRSLAPKAIWENFYLLTQVPRPSGHLDKIQAFLLGWAKEHGVDASLDKAGNVLMKKPASPGMENRKTVVLQAHMDMVPQKASDSAHCFETDPIEPYIDGEWVKARGTTLGADDGMGVATIMAIMEDPTLVHGSLEGFITADEESTMGGVNGMSTDLLEGRILLNLDNETDGEMIIGSAGGVNLNATGAYTPEPCNAVPDRDCFREVVLTGLRGGHSGLEINEGRANANKLMARFIDDVTNVLDARLVAWEGGNMRNAIPREARATFFMREDNVSSFDKLVEEYAKTFAEEYAAIEPDLSFSSCKPAPAPDDDCSLVPMALQKQLVKAVNACHDGVMRFIPEIPEIVETSSNLAIIRIGGGSIQMQALVRSSMDSMRRRCANTVGSALSLAGLDISLSGDYPAWQPNPKSEIVEIMKKAYSDLFGVKNHVQVVHAGLECGVIGAKYDGMDMVSFGPTLRSPHTPSERLLIATVDRYYRFVLETLRRIPEA